MKHKLHMQYEVRGWLASCVESSYEFMLIPDARDAERELQPDEYGHDHHIDFRFKETERECPQTWRALKAHPNKDDGAEGVKWISMEMWK